MKIIVDADACPQTAKKILVKAAIRTNHALIFVANQPIFVEKDPLIKTVRVASGADVADDYIVNHVEAHDLVITADIPLAARVVEKQGAALNPRGEFYTADNINERLSLRNFMQDLRSAGVNTGGAKPQSAQDIKRFADALDRYLQTR